LGVVEEGGEGVTEFDFSGGGEEDVGCFYVSVDLALTVQIDEPF
jgi:hypothetical protein